MNYQDINAKTIDSWVEGGWEWGTPVSREECDRARAGEWSVLLTPTRPVPVDWFGDLRGKKLLGLASGGGQQMPIFAIAGADCTVFDYSEKQLEQDRMVSERENYPIRIVRGDMSKPLPFGDGEFDVIFHPVSNVYIREVLPLWRECFRILKPGGRLLAGLDNGLCYALDDAEERIVRGLPFDPMADEKLLEESLASDSGVQFSHTMDEQIRGQIQAGFRILDLYEDTNGFGRLEELKIPTFWATLAQKPM